MDDRPIGVFDSGFGGLTVARAVIDLLPGRTWSTSATPAAIPTGPRPLDEVRTLRPADHDQAGRRTRRQDGRGGVQHGRRGRPRRPAGSIDVPVRERHRARPAGGAAGHRDRPRRGDRHGRHDRVGRLPAGPGRSIADGARSSSTCAACPGSWSSSSGARPTRTRSTCWPNGCWLRSGRPRWTRCCSGCTHYPFLARTISDVVGRDVVLVSSADETAFELRASLAGTDWAGAATEAGDPHLDLLRRRRDLPHGSAGGCSGQRSTGWRHGTSWR